MSTTELRLAEATELLTAWVSARAEQHGIRALVIKGRTLADDGLRPARVSSDVDLLVEPDRFDELCARITESGWTDLPGTFAGRHFSVHSRTLRREGWPAALDIHREYPGLLRDPAEAFEALWRSRRVAVFGHRGCPVPSRPAGAVILALHGLRGTRRQARHANDVARLPHVRFRASEHAELSRLVVETGAAPALGPLLAAWDLTVDVDDGLRATARGRAWRRKVAESEGSALSWVFLLRRVPWREKPGIIGRALWPHRDDLARSSAETPGGAWSRLRTRLARLRRGIAGIVPALRALRRS